MVNVHLLQNYYQMIEYNHVIYQEQHVQILLRQKIYHLQVVYQIQMDNQDGFQILTQIIVELVYHVQKLWQLIKIFKFVNAVNI